MADVDHGHLLLVASGLFEVLGSCLAWSKIPCSFTSRTLSPISSPARARENLTDTRTVRFDKGTQNCHNYQSANDENESLVSPSG